MNDIRIEAIEERDFPELVALFKEFALFEKLPEKMLNSVDRMEHEKNFINGFTVKSEDGRIVGYVTFFFAYYTWTGKALYMDDLYIRPECRGCGLGTLLIKKVIAFAKENCCRKLRWQVSNWNDPAICFYENLGAEINRVEINCDLDLGVAD